MSEFDLKLIHYLFAGDRKKITKFFTTIHNLQSSKEDISLSIKEGLKLKLKDSEEYLIDLALKIKCHMEKIF